MEIDTLEGIVNHTHPWIQAYFHGERARARLAARESQSWSVRPITPRSAPSWCWYSCSARCSSTGTRTAASIATTPATRSTSRAASADSSAARQCATSASMSAASCSMNVDSRDASRVQVIVDIDSSAPVSARTVAELSLQGVTGLLYVDLISQHAATGGSPAPCRASDIPVIRSARSNFDVLLSSLPELIGLANEVVERANRMLSDENLAAVASTPAQHQPDEPRSCRTTVREVHALVTELRGTAADIRTVAQSVNRTTQSVGPDFAAAMKRVNDVADNLVGASAQLEQLVKDNRTRSALLHARCAAGVRALPARWPFRRPRDQRARARPARGSLAAPLPDAAARRGDSAMRRLGALRFDPGACLAAARLLGIVQQGHRRRIRPTSCAPHRAEGAASRPNAPSLRIGRTLAAPGLDADRMVLVRSDHRMDYYAASRWVATDSADGRRPRGGDTAQQRRVELPCTIRRALFRRTTSCRSTSAVSRRITPKSIEPKVHVVLDCTLGRRTDRERLRHFVAEGSAPPVPIA